MKTPYYRPCMVIDGCSAAKAMFHRWEKQGYIEEFQGESGKTYTSAVSKIVGLVELTNGEVLCVPCERIRFTDKLAKAVIEKERTEDDD